MKDLIEHASPWVGLAALVVNFVWSSLNLRLLRSMEKKFVTKEAFHGEQRFQGVRHSDLLRRVARLEGA